MEHCKTNETPEFEDVCIACRLKELLGLAEEATHEDAMSKLGKLTSRIDKPCLDRFEPFPDETCCPYGSLVEKYPRIPMSRDEAEGMDEWNRELLAKGESWTGKPLDEQERIFLQMEVDSFIPADYPDLPYEINMVRCECFDCACPAFFPMQISAIKKKK